MVWYGGEETWKTLTGVSREERLEERMNTLGRVISIVERQEERVNTRWNAHRRVSSGERLEEGVDTSS